MRHTRTIIIICSFDLFPRQGGIVRVWAFFFIQVNSLSQCILRTSILERVKLHSVLTPHSVVVYLNTRCAWAGGTFFPVVLLYCVSFWFWWEIGFGFTYSHATLIGTPCVLPLEGPIIWKVPLTEKALTTYVCVPAKTSVRPKPGPIIWKVPISKVPITVARLYLFT